MVEDGARRGAAGQCCGEIFVDAGLGDGVGLVA